MIIRQLKQKQYEDFNKELIKKAYSDPLEASYTVNMTVNDVFYVVKVQPENRHRMAILQACKVKQNKDNQDFELVTKGNLLLALFEILNDQWVR
ncbi:MAG: hypothetical protein RR614_01645 [Eubacterium sp.]